MIAIYIKATDEINYAIICEDTLHGMQQLVGGHIEIVHPINLPRPYVMVVNEEGLLRDLPINNTGALLYGGPIAGNVLILKEGINEDGEPDLLSLDDGEAHELMDKLLSRFPYLEVPA